MAVARRPLDDLPVVSPAHRLALEVAAVLLAVPKRLATVRALFEERIAIHDQTGRSLFPQHTLQSAWRDKKITQLTLNTANSCVLYGISRHQLRVPFFAFQAVYTSKLHNTQVAHAIL